MIVEIEHSKAGKIKVVGVPYKLSETPAEVRLAPPTLGEHTVQILQGILGHSADELTQWKEDGVV
jgi:crotonobetainyl-CoA:carnitine CoA-transferase CaiB-like acyl-CoA transferase